MEETTTKETIVTFWRKAPVGRRLVPEHTATFDGFPPIPDVGDTITYSNPIKGEWHKNAGIPGAVARKILSRHFSHYDGESVHVDFVVEEASDEFLRERVPKL